jgi:hypothetical protein
VKRRFAQFLAGLDEHPWLGVMFLILFGFAYCFPALRSPFWVGNDAWSNLLPIIHYRDSILNHHTLPLYTDLWYGGRAQWANPLWNFLYAPATIIYLIIPLDWGTRIVYFGHLIFILLAARKLSSLFLESEIERISAAIILASPSLPAFTAGQSEKIMSWGWALLGLYFLLETRRDIRQKGLLTGLCLGIIPITGSNYYALYAGILFLPLVVSFKNKKLIAFFILGAMIGLVHLPSVWHLIGQPRANAVQSIQELSLSFAGIFSSLSIGLAKPMGWETWAPVGVPVIYLLFKKVFLKLKNHNTVTPLETPLIFSLIVLVLLATSLAYQGHHLLDSFRVPARAISFIALVVTLLVLTIQTGGEKLKPDFLLVLSALQVGILSFMIQPYGAAYSPYDAQAQTLANILKADGAKSTWISMRELNDMYIQAVLTQNGIALPNVYYGDMGQEIKITGDYCSYSFDHLIAAVPVGEKSVELKADMEWSDTKGKMPLNDLYLIEQTTVHNVDYDIYRVVCSSQDNPH